MFRVATLVVSISLSSPALTQPEVQMVPPSPGTIEDPSIPIKLIADGPPRPLIRTDLPDKPANAVIAVNTLNAAR
jgi:hypothetical protein